MKIFETNLKGIRTTYLKVLLKISVKFKLAAQFTGQNRLLI